MAGSLIDGFVGATRDPSLTFLARSHSASAPTRPAGERPIEARVRTLQATAGNAAVGQILQRQARADAEVGGKPDEPQHSLLQYGARGDEVRDLQARLNQAGAARPQLVLDGVFGRKTQAAVRRFQETHPPIAVDGDAGPETWSALDRARTEPVPAADTAQPSTDPFDVGREHFRAGRYGRAYDEFTKAYEATADPALLWDRAEALRLLGGRRDDAIALFDKLIAEVASEDVKAAARLKVAELRGPGTSSDKARNERAVQELYRKGATFFRAEEYARAYDEFTKAYEITRDLALLWNRAQALRLLGGRRAETIALLEQFIAADVPEDRKKAAASDIAELRGPGKGNDERANLSAADILYNKGRAHFIAEEYAQAYDEFSEAHEITGDPALLYNRAQALRLLGGRRTEAVALFEQFIAANVSEDMKKAARAHLEDLRGPVRKDARAAQPSF
jgi:tetratricopeptide (TPR) repeat protein